jgi:hypothetical protein
MDAAGANVRHVLKTAKADLLSRFSILLIPLRAAAYASRVPRRRVEGT